jgi:hypothetical protein
MIPIVVEAGPGFGLTAGMPFAKCKQSKVEFL